MSTRFAEVLVPLGIDEPYSYAVPDGLALAVGDLVHVPLGPRIVTGVVWQLSDAPRFANRARLRAIDARVEVEGFRPELMGFLDWLAAYTLAPRGTVLRMALRLNENLGPPRPRVGVRRVGPEPARMTAQRARVLAALEGGLSFAKSDLVREVGVSVAVIDGLIDEGTLEALELPPEPLAPRPDPDHPALALSARKARRRWPWWGRSPPAALPPSCSTASPAPARPRSISRRSPRRCGAAGRCWSCCRRSR